MDEKSLIKQWNHLRLQIIQAQVAPALVLIAIVALAAIGSFETASDGAKYLALGVAAVTSEPFGASLDSCSIRDGVEAPASGEAQGQRRAVARGVRDIEEFER